MACEHEMFQLNSLQFLSNQSIFVDTMQLPDRTLSWRVARALVLESPLKLLPNPEGSIYMMHTYGTDQPQLKWTQCICTRREHECITQKCISHVKVKCATADY